MKIELTSDGLAALLLIFAYGNPTEEDDEVPMPAFRARTEDGPPDRPFEVTLTEVQAALAFSQFEPTRMEYLECYMKWNDSIRRGMRELEIEMSLQEADTVYNPHAND